MKEWSNLAKIVYKRTYSRKDSGKLESWNDTVERAIMGNVKGHNVPESEVKELLRLAKERKAGPAGRGYWFSGAPAHERLGGAALTNCWFFTADDWYHYVIAQDLLMLGGGVGMSVEHKYSSKLPRVKRGVNIEYKPTKDADFIIPDSREGWCELTRRILESYFVTGKSFSYSTVCVRGAGEPIRGFGGVSSGPMVIVTFVDTLKAILGPKEGKSLSPVDSADILTAIAAMVVAGNVRRSAILILGDCWDKEFLKIKRWDLTTIPAHRGNANYSIVCEDIEDVHPLFWKTYEFGEPIGIVNRKNIQKYGRMGELKKDTAYGVNPCGEATLENGEPCNLTEIALCNIDNEDEFVNAARLMHRYSKRVTMEKYHHDICDEVIKRNRRVGTGITGCLNSYLYTAKILDRAYKAIQDENVKYSKELGIPISIRTTLGKPSGTIAKCYDCDGYEGAVTVPLSQYMIQRIRIASNDQLIVGLKEAGHYMEPVVGLDGTTNHDTMVVDFYVKAPDGAPTVENGFDTWKQLESLMLAQKHWADQAVSCTVYYKKDEIPQIKAWLQLNLKNIKTISFLLESGHGFKQAPKESITEEQYEKLSTKIRPLDEDKIQDGDLESMECVGGMCPVK